MEFDGSDKKKEKSRSILQYVVGWVLSIFSGFLLLGGTIMYFTNGFTESDTAVYIIFFVVLLCGLYLIDKNKKDDVDKAVKEACWNTYMPNVGPKISWAVVILVLVFFWPVGLYLLYKKMSRYSNPEEVLKNSRTLGNCALVFMCLGAFYFVMFFTSGMEAWAGVLMFLFFFAMGLPFGIRARSLAKLYATLPVTYDTQGTFVGTDSAQEEPTFTNAQFENVYAEAMEKERVLSVKKKPRKGMMIGAIICFVFGGIYGLMAIMELMMLGMAAFCGIFGIMFLVLSVTPKQSHWLFGLQKGICKTHFVIVSVTVAFCAFGFIAFQTDGMTVQMSTSTTTSVTTEAAPSATTEATAPTTAKAGKVTSIGAFKKSEYALLVGERVELSIELTPKDLTAESVGVEVSDSSVISVSNIVFTTEKRKTVMTFQCTAVGAGETMLVVRSHGGDITSNKVTFRTEQPPIVASFVKTDPYYAVQEVGDKREVSVYMKPKGLTMDDIIVENTDETVISIDNIAFRSEDKQTVLTFTVTGVGAGKASIKIKGADGKTESNPVQFVINEKDTSRRVYVTPYGEKYHYSAACAGSTATETTENQAIRSGKDRCKKCG